MAADIFDQVAAKAPAEPASGDIFDQAAASGVSLTHPPLSVPPPDAVDKITAATAQAVAETATRPQAPPEAPAVRAPRGGMSGFLEQLVAPFRDSQLGHAFGVDTRTDARRAEQGNGLVNFENALPYQQPGAVRGAAEVASGLTTPENLLLLAGMPQGLVGKLVSLGFSAQMITDAARQVPGFVDAVKAKDYGAARQIATKATLGTFLAAVGAKHASTPDLRASEAAPKAVRGAQAPEEMRPGLARVSGDIFDQVADKTERTENVTQRPIEASRPEGRIEEGQRVDAGARSEQPGPPDGPRNAGVEPPRPEAGREAEAPRPVAPPVVAGGATTVSRETQPPSSPAAPELPAAPNEGGKQEAPLSSQFVRGIAEDPAQRRKVQGWIKAKQKALDAHREWLQSKGYDDDGVATKMARDIDWWERSVDAAKPPTAPSEPARERPLAAEQIPLEPKKGATSEFLKDESGNSMVGAVLKADLAEARALVAKRNAALEELRKAEASPTEQRFGKRVLEYYTAERDTWGARVNQVMDRLRKLVPAPAEQEALSLMRDFKNRPGELQQFAMGTHPDLAKMAPDDYALAMENMQKLRPAIELAINPTPRMRAADAALTQISAATLKEGQAYGFLDSSISPDEYVTHLLHPKGEAEFATPLTERMGKAMGGKIGRRFAFAQKRNYPTLLHAIADNVKPRTLNAIDAFTIHGDKFATARATHELVDALKRQGVGKWGTKGSENIPEGWVEIAPHAHPFQNAVKFTDTEGNPQVARQTLFVPKVIERALRPITDPDYTSKIAGFTKLRVFQAYTKAVQLGLSMFHATTENYMALANMGPKGWAKGLMANRDAPEFLEAERAFISHGGTTPIQGRTFEAYKSLQPGSIPTWGDIWKTLPGVASMDRAAESITRFTFDKLQRQFKVTDYSLHEAAWYADHPHATAAEEGAALSSIAKEINAVYGGLHWENLGVNRTSLEILRAIMLAPDWTFSNVFNLKYSMERGTPAGHLARAFWARQIAGGIAATQALSLMVGHRPSKNPTQVYMGKDKDGQEIYQNVFFKGAPGDVVNLINNVHDYGAVLGLTKSMAGKAAPIPRTLMQLGMNRNYLGQEMIPRGMNPIAGTVRGAFEAAKGIAPTPLSVANIKDMLIGPHADRYTAPEFLTTIFAGTPPRHVPPDGMRMTKKGLRDKHEKPRQSILGEITSGKR